MSKCRGALNRIDPRAEKSTMIPPTITQQKGLTFAPIPCAAASFFSSGYVIYYLLCKERQKLERLYHRLVLSMNFALLPLSFALATTTFAAPEGTPYFLGASGTIETCTAQGFIITLFFLVVPTYYMSLSLQAFMGIRNNFKEEKYRWIEKYIHVVACSISTALSAAIAANQNFNPGASYCAVGKYPQGCETDPDVPCQRGKYIKILRETFNISFVLICFVLPPSVATAMYCWIRKLHNKKRGDGGMQRIRYYAQKQMMRSIAIQISVYLLSFWFTFAPMMIALVYRNRTGGILYNLNIIANCLFALQGIIMAVVYFLLQKLGKRRVQDIGIAPLRSGFQQGLTVEDIRTNAQRKCEIGPETATEERISYIFNIFDGEPDEDSPWAKFITQDDYDSDNSVMPDEGEPTLANEDTKQMSLEFGTSLAIDAEDDSGT